jgi:hypothetical protein
MGGEDSVLGVLGEIMGLIHIKTGEDVNKYFFTKKLNPQLIILGASWHLGTTRK